MRTPPLLADFIHARPCKPFCEKLLTLPFHTSLNKIESDIFMFLPQRELKKDVTFLSELRVDG